MSSSGKASSPAKAARSMLDQSGLIWKDGNPILEGETELSHHSFQYYFIFRPAYNR